MPTAATWNELVLASHRFASPNFNARRPAVTTPTHIVIHITGEEKLDSVKNTFMAKDSVSAHYLVLKDGQLLQFVPDAYRSWHAGINSNTRAVYRKGAAVWMRYLKYFSWYHSYPADAVYLDGDFKPVWDQTEAAFVARADGGLWPEYQYFKNRWPGLDMPVNFDVDPDPNNYSIGIETMGYGAKTNDPTAYTPQMYATLKKLVQNLSQKYGIPIQKGRVVGHEDVNPIGRFGWDPAAGFEWSKIGI